MDYETSISLHPVITTNKKERRLQRLRSPSAGDNRITFGCINVPSGFYEDIVRPLFADTSGIVYILPEHKYLFEVFPAFRPDARPASTQKVGVEPGGEGGIRTHGELAPTAVFKTAALNHSATSPRAGHPSFMPDRLSDGDGLCKARDECIRLIGQPSLA